MTSIITWNVNGIRAIHKKGFLDWLETESPDVLCVQEIKGRPEQVPEALRQPEGYHSYWTPAQRPGYSGLLTYSKKPVLQYEPLGVDIFDNEGRVQVLYFTNYVLINTYFPNSQEKGRRLEYKLGFCQAILALCQRLEKEGHSVILCGDYNIAHKPIDLARPESNEENPGYLPEERAWMDVFTDVGFLDVFRLFETAGGHYTWWSYRTRARERNIGWRIDYHCITPDLQPRIKDCEILSDIVGSDHCPVKLLLF